MDGDAFCIVAEAWMKAACFCFNKCIFTICTILLNIYILHIEWKTEKILTLVNGMNVKS